MTSCACSAVTFDRYDHVQQLGGGLVYLCRSEGQAPVVAKLLPDTSRGASSYPTDLHKEAASKGLAPHLVGEVRPGQMC